MNRLIPMEGYAMSQRNEMAGIDVGKNNASQRKFGLKDQIGYLLGDFGNAFFLSL